MAKKYYPRAYKRLILQDRDLEIMNKCLEQKFLTVEQISRRFFKPAAYVKNKQKKAYERVLILQRFGLMKLEALFTGEKVVQTTKKGTAELMKHGYDPLPPLASVDYRNFEHDRRVSDVRITYEEVRLLADWKSERSLKSQFTRFRRVPDALFTLTNGQRVALEVEIARKGRQRYRKIFSEYLEKLFGNIELLFYVCNTLRQLENLAKLTHEHQWIYYAMYEQLMKNKAKTIFANKKDSFRLEEINGRYLV